MNLYSIVSFKKDLGDLMFSIVLQDDIEPEVIERLLIDYELCNGDKKQLQEALNIFNMYDKSSALELLLHGSLLITVDTDVKQFAWALRQCGIKDLEEITCDYSKIMI